MVCLKQKNLSRPLLCLAVPLKLDTKGLMDNMPYFLIITWLQMGIVYWHICITPDESIVKSHQSTQWWHLCATLFVHSLSGHYFIICLISRSNIIVYFTGGIVLLPGLQTFWTTPIKHRSGTFTLNQCPIGSDPSAFVMWVFFHCGVYISILLDRNTWEIHHQAASDIKMRCRYVFLPAKVALVVMVIAMSNDISGWCATKLPQMSNQIHINPFNLILRWL